MFEDTGKTIMRISRVFLAVCLALTIALGVFVWVQLHSAVSTFLCLLCFLAVILIGGFLAFAAAHALYALGQLADDLHQLRLDQAVEPSSSYARAGYTLPGQRQTSGSQRRSQAGRNRREAVQREQQPAQETVPETAPPPQTDAGAAQAGWVQVDPIYLRCPGCGSRMTPEFALAHHGCPQCGTPYRP